MNMFQTTPSNNSLSWVSCVLALFNSDKEIKLQDQPSRSLKSKGKRQEEMAKVSWRNISWNSRSLECLSHDYCSFIPANDVKWKVLVTVFSDVLLLNSSLQEALGWSINNWERGNKVNPLIAPDYCLKGVSMSQYKRRKLGRVHGLRRHSRGIEEVKVDRVCSAESQRGDSCQDRKLQRSENFPVESSAEY